MQHGVPSLSEAALLQVFDGFDLDHQRRLIEKLMKRAQLITAISHHETLLDTDFVSFASKEFSPLTYQDFHRMHVAWQYLKRVAHGAARHACHLNLWNQPNDNYEEYAVEAKEQIMDEFVKTGTPSEVCIYFEPYHCWLTLTTVCKAEDPLALLREINW